MEVHSKSDRPPAAPWLALSIGSLVLAGFFALFLVLGRVPPFSGWFGSPELFKRCLVVHVDLAIVIWFHAFAAGLFAELPVARPASALRRSSTALAILGVLLLLGCIFVEDARPILSNYVPSLDHPLFLAGIGAFFVGTALGFLDERMLPSRERLDLASPIPPEARPGLRASALAFLFAVLTFLGSASSLPEGLLAETRNELLFWGGGHVLQVSSVAAMLAVWLILLRGAIGGPAMSRGTAGALFTLLVVPTAFAPLLAASGAATVRAHDGFTRMMELGIFPVVLVFGGLCLRAVRRCGVSLASPRLYGFWASVLLTLVGFALGATIRGSNTLVPAHYHASIGAVTASFMALTYTLFAHHGLEQPSARLSRAASWQPLLFGLGQTVFALGFALAGSEGMARKAYGSEQHIRTTTELVGLVVMGLGGLVAVAGGLLFMSWVLSARWSASSRALERGSNPWPIQPTNIPSKP